jgi:hypothetical protein
MKTLEDSISQYNSALMEIYNYFGYGKNWVVIPLSFNLCSFWMICGPENHNSTKIAFSNIPFTEKSIKKGDNYSGRLYTQRYLKQWVYRGEDYTMVSVGTYYDGNKYLMVFENKLECKDEKLKKLYLETWSKNCYYYD